MALDELCTMQKKALHDWHKERLIPKKTPWYSKRIVTEHLLRYRFVEKFVHSKVVADIACGVGYGCLELINLRAATVIGIDKSKEAINYANQHYQHKDVTYVLADATKTNLKENSVDIVTSFETLEHLPKPKLFLTEVKRILRPNGLFIVSTPNREMSLEENPFHHQEYDLDEFKNLLSGFQLLDIYGQTPVNLQLMRLMQKILNNLPPSLQKLLTFRPWESPRIQHLGLSPDTFYLTYIAVCCKR